MDSSAIGSAGSLVAPSSSPSSSKWNSYGFVLAMILAIGGIGVGIGGICAFNNLAQAHAITMMTIGGVGIALLILGVIGKLNSLKSRDLVIKTPQAESLNRLEGAALIQSLSGSKIYGPDAWRIFDFEVREQVPQAPEIDWEKEKDKILLYIPKEVNLNVLKHFCGGLFDYSDENVEKEFGHRTDPGWVLMGTQLISQDVAGGDHEAQSRYVEDQGGNLPHLLHAVAFNLMTFTITRKRLYAPSYTRCVEMLYGICSIVVGGFDESGLHIDISSTREGDKRNSVAFSKKL